MSHRIVFTKLIFNEEDKVDKWKIVNFLEIYEIMIYEFKNFFPVFSLKLGSFKMIFYWITKRFLLFPAVIRLNFMEKMLRDDVKLFLQQNNSKQKQFAF